MIVPTQRTTLPTWQGWELLLLSPAGAWLFTPADLPRWVQMWILAVAIFVGCKWLTWRRTPVVGVPAWQHLAYLFGWPGLHARAFLRARRTGFDFAPSLREWAFAAAKTLFGVLLLWGVARLVPPQWDLVVAWVGMSGVIFVLHFGLFHLLSCFWRQLGLDAKPLMQWPIAATSVSNFWGQRWNTAFRDLTHRFLFQPLTVRVGAKAALLIGFLMSGLVHDAVISLPAGGGYGGPTLFFMIQAAALFFERTRLAQQWGLSRGWRGWLYTLCVLVLPAGLLFHPTFARAIVLPMLHAVGAIS